MCSTQHWVSKSLNLYTIFVFVFVCDTASKPFCYTQEDDIANGEPNEPMTTRPNSIHPPVQSINKTSIELLWNACQIKFDLWIFCNLIFDFTSLHSTRVPVSLCMHNIHLYCILSISIPIDWLYRWNKVFPFKILSQTYFHELNALREKFLPEMTCHHILTYTSYGQCLIQFIPRKKLGLKVISSIHTYIHIWNAITTNSMFPETSLK